MTKMTRAESWAYLDALEEWLDLRDELESERKRFGRGTPEAEKAFLRCELARERCIDALSEDEDPTQPMAGRGA